jgi:hypothetical protein
MKTLEPTGESVIGVDEMPYYKFGVEYLMPDGTEWSFTIWAKSWEEADLRLRMIKDTARIEGQTLETFPANETDI